VGYAYTGPLESWLLNEGYATSAATLPDAWANDSDGILGAFAPSVTVTPTAAVLVGSAAASATVGADGDVTFATEGGVTTTVSLLTADTAAQAATKIDTALAGLADAAIVSTKLQVTSTATGTTAYVTVVDGDAAVLTALKLAVGDIAYGGDGRPTGASNLGVQADTPANDPQAKANREAPYWPNTPDLDVTIANDATHLTETVHRAPGFDLDVADADTEAPSNITIEPNTGVEEGGEEITIFGRNLEGVTVVKFGGSGGTAGTGLDVSAAGDGVITVISPAHAPGLVDVFLDDGSTDTTVTGGFTFVATP
jgi:hypothetical protein